MLAWMPGYGGALLLAYGFVGVATFGHLWRHGRSDLRHRAVYCLAALAWPVYWLVIYGVEASVRTAIAPLKASLETVEPVTVAAGAVWCLGALFFPAFYIARHWETCETWDCSLGIVAKALIWTPFWPAYLFV